jgi:hypothetical protein
MLNVRYWLLADILLKNGEEDAAKAKAGSVGISGAVQKREGRPRFEHCPAWTGS